MKTIFSWKRIAILAMILVALPILLCVALAIFGPRLAHSIHQSTWKNDPAKAAEIAYSLADYILPAGYQETSYAQVMDASQVILASADGSAGMTILFMQESMAMNDRGIVTEMEDAWAKEVGVHTYTTSRTSSETVTIGGQETTVSYRTGTDETGQPVRQLVTVFYGKTGWAVLVIVSQMESWNQSLVDEFLQSLN
jgi:hypothetical protein